MMVKKETFWTDRPIAEKLASIPDGERAVIIRMALRQYFGISPSKPPEPITPDDARRIAQELMREKKKSPPPEG